jgi:aspartate aminotransferase
VLRIAGEVRAAVAAGRDVVNFTVGDFEPREFPLPRKLVDGIKAALDAGHSNYPPSNGILELRKAVLAFYQRELQLDYPLESVMIAGGARPLIYAAYRTLVDPGDGVVFPVPSWNNNHYAYLCGGRAIPLEVKREHQFHPTPEQVAAVLPGARLLSLSSPLNPTGTGIRPEVLAAICQQVVDENRRRERTGERALFLLFDQVYWATAFDSALPASPPSLVPEVAPWTVLVDAISKSLAATGLRVGWALAHPAVTARMSDLLGHIGAWAPKPEQVATAGFLADPAAFHEFRSQMAVRLRTRLQALHAGIVRLRARGLPVEAVEPEGTLYLSVRFALGGTLRGRTIHSNEDMRKLLLEEAGVAVVPFQAFALPHEDGWFRLSVGAVSVADIERGLERLERVLGEATAR